ncbi:CheF family chemotaxis protein [Salinirubellus salinus]|uniref:Taxis protein CheF n=1 Tax=Salinirubellus salinus TaxID=1364945 RepID=A0A9E7R153_9EURY|nr:CheF family chemotaxis protein [Salinirubellus salinus]UWM52988.1 CheF family chemotaxis protein [Salinirubellus salinus]
MQRTDERRLADARGKFCWARRSGRPVDDADWTPGRVLLSNRRLVLAGTGGKLTVALSKVTNVGGRFDVNQRVAGEADYLSVHIDEDVLLVVVHDETFETAFYGALVGRDALRTRHPAKVGGVVKDSEWQDARVKVEPDAVAMATPKGEFVEIPYDDVGAVRSAERTVEGSTRRVLEVEHADEEGTSVETYFTGKARQCAILATVFGQREDHVGVDVDLDETEQQVVMALYSGVSPFDIPDFLGIDVDEAEELVERLLELQVVEEVRVRREVELNARGRHIAGDVIETQ